MAGWATTALSLKATQRREYGAFGPPPVSTFVNFGEVLWTLDATLCYPVSDDCLCLWFTSLSQQPRREGNILWMLGQALAKFTVPFSLRLHLPTYNFALFFLSPNANGNWIPIRCQPSKHPVPQMGEILSECIDESFLSHSKYKKFAKFSL